MPPMSFTVRPPEESDRAAWARLRVAMWPGLEAEQNEAEMIGILDDDERAEVFVAAGSDGQLWGFVEVALRPWAEGCTTPPPIGHVDACFVVEGLRGRGVGRALLSAVEAWARDRGCLEMGSDAEIDDPGTIAAHRAIGYREVGRAVHFLKPLVDEPADYCETEPP